jgi:hypothetical protein
VLAHKASPSAIASVDSYLAGISPSGKQQSCGKAEEPFYLLRSVGSSVQGLLRGLCLDATKIELNAYHLSLGVIDAVKRPPVRLDGLSNPFRGWERWGMVNQIVQLPRTLMSIVATTMEAV